MALPPCWQVLAGEPDDQGRRRVPPGQGMQKRALFFTT